MPFESVLATVVCQTNLATIGALFAKVGLHVKANAAPGSFRILSGGRATFPDPVVDDELVAMALQKMEVAHNDGALPSFSIVTHHPVKRLS